MMKACLGPVAFFRGPQPRSPFPCRQMSVLDARAVKMRGSEGRVIEGVVGGPFSEDGTPPSAQATVAVIR